MLKRSTENMRLPRLSGLLVLVFSFCGCQDREGSAIQVKATQGEIYVGSVTWDHLTVEDQHPVYEALLEHGVKCFMGDHAGRATALFCNEAEVSTALRVIEALPEKVRQQFHADPELREIQSN